ncbi:hypothetical protein [Komagataeibacter xylinus]|uniref:hypothetical protein n=1 Tax=Komagataeibacter xylinus TaxID=28448 RepID=UPI00280BC872|nr:hypothetical protein [Komagataeibacter xylinus]
MDTRQALLEALRGGNVITQAFRALRGKLGEIFPDTYYSHRVVPPKSSPAMWKDLIRTAPMIGLGWAGFTPDRDCGKIYRGDLVFVIFCLSEARELEDIYTGDANVAGIMGEAAMCLHLLQGWKIAGIGTCHVRQCTTAEVANWVDDGQGIVAIEVVVRNVAFDDATYIATLNRFVSMNMSMPVNGEKVATTGIDTTGSQT